MPFLIALIAPVFWGTTYALVSLYLKDMSPFWVAVWRALPAGILLLLLRPKLPHLPWRKIVLLAFCNIGAFFALLFIAAYRLPGAVAGTLGATLPLMFILLAWVLDRQRPGLKWLALGLLGLSGVLMLLNPSANLDPLGVACVLLATLLIAQSSRWMQRWDVGDLLTLTAWQLFLGGLMLIPLAWFMAGPPQLPPATAFPAIAWLAIANTAVAYWAWLWSLRRLGPQIMGMLALTNPMVAVSLGVILVGESLDLQQWTGIALILSALLLMKLPVRRWFNALTAKRTSLAKGDSGA
ncbi:DMT family transporter [Shewanella sp. AS16]|uniref:DMT family transporter n=1 Tax=Shewanella sp. AS16 TaxID=2907625 RepID=UPI001F3B361D|nr:EamA family transporter [Shewanella sp. AS16]MCE9687973.1 DMT family transporter [Shewanella sp. AS16]